MTHDAQISPADMTRKLAKKTADITEPEGSDTLPSGDSPAAKMAQQSKQAPGGKV